LKEKKLNLNSFNDFISNMNNSNSTNDKIKTMSSVDETIKKILYYTYNPFIQFGITAKLLNKRKDLTNKNTQYTSGESLFDLLDSLNDRRLTGHAAIKEVNGFLLHNSEFCNLVDLVLGRNLKIRVSTKLINKAIPGLIPTFNVALANKYDEKTKKKVDFKKDAWFVSRKLDGVRCLVVVDEKGKAKSYSRAGKQFNTLKLIEKEIENLGFKNIVYDGEMCIVDEEDNEDFQSIMKEINRKDHIIENGLYQVFDFIPYEMFLKGEGRVGTFSQRIETLQKTIISKSNRYLSFLEQTPIFSFEELDKLNEIASAKGWEGLMIRKNDFYKGKRSNDILKVKVFHDHEYKVIDILGKIITVQYFEESQNQNGEYSLRFPVIKHIHGEKRIL
jgi:DNA ligase-1